MIIGMKIKTKMTPELYEWLHEIWVRHNHAKYRKYFEEWIENLTEGQIKGFSKMEQRRNVYDK
jgi:hypothetical protein